MARPRKDAIKTPTKERILTAAEAQFGQHGYTPLRSPISPSKPVFVGLRSCTISKAKRFYTERFKRHYLTI